MLYAQLLFIFCSAFLYGIDEYLIPDDHPAKKVLDVITKEQKGSVFHDLDSMTMAGFDYADPQPTTGIIVTRHPCLQGYVIKAYLDTQEYYAGRPESYYFEKRAEGADLIRLAIAEYNYDHLLKVPKKWIYKLPKAAYRPLPANCKPKQYILIEDDMDILSDEENKEMWKSTRATRELLDAIYTVVTKYRFRDCTKPANCPFTKDGRVAFVDTQSFYKKKVGYKKLTRYLSPEMQQYWKSLYGADLG